MVAAVSARVGDGARDGDGVRSLVQLGREDIVGPEREALARDQQLVDERVGLAGGLPAVGCEVAEQQAAAVA